MKSCWRSHPGAGAGEQSTVGKVILEQPLPSHEKTMMALKTRALRLKQLKSHTPVEVNNAQALLHCMRKALNSSGNMMTRNPVGKVILEQVL